ncbi:DUF2871 domain-containing protein [Nocardia sp. NPDC051030]|uniref:DUF2871 domain-containing protein n=1 Tax=Nocardia sp. NPDC051030 TaxID=3155162 RepID=UPI0034188FFA
MRKLYFAAALYTLLGLAAGLYYRDLTKAHDFTGRTELAVTHTHLLALGTLFLLIVIALEKQFALSETKTFPWFFWTYNAGVLWTTVFMTIHGTLTVLGQEVSAVISGLAGLGHILLTAGFLLFFICLYRPVTSQSDRAHSTPVHQSHQAI